VLRQQCVDAGCEIVELTDTRRFARSFELFAEMFELQFGWDALQIVGLNRDLLGPLTGQLETIRDLGRAGKVTQTRVVAKTQSSAR